MILQGTTHLAMKQPLLTQTNHFETESGSTTLNLKKVIQLLLQLILVQMKIGGDLDIRANKVILKSSRNRCSFHF